MPTFGVAERKIAQLLREGCTFIFQDQEYSVINSGKPTCQKGEPKTDIYVEARSDIGDTIEIKISYKMENADFIENKTNAERAKALFGDDWSNIILRATESIKTVFESKKLIYKKGFGNTEQGSITLGWKYELLNKKSGELSGKVDLTRNQIIDVYAGTNLSKDKRDATVNGVQVTNSGIANYILMNDDVASTQEVIDNLYSIPDYVDMHPEVYFACKALNYRTFSNKYDGNRPLSVYVNWYINNGKLCHDLVFDEPLMVVGGKVANKLITALENLNVNTTDDLSAEMVSDPLIIFC